MNQNPSGTSKTMYDWCINRELKIVGLEEYKDVEFDFYTKYISEEEFNTSINNLRKEKVFERIEIKEGELHLKSDKYLELRMYTLVPYNLLGIQMGIQHEHSVVQNVVNNVIEKIISGEEMDEKFKLWATEWKTSILLNGGTSNEGHMVRHGFKDIWYVGSMQQYLEKLVNAGINISTFYEPDLNSMLTGISFIVDERVFNRKLYKDFVPTPYNFLVDGINEETVRCWEENNNMNKAIWLDNIGGEKNEFLRELLNPKGPLKLARG